MRLEVQFLAVSLLYDISRQVVHTHASVAMQYNLLIVKGKDAAVRLESKGMRGLIVLVDYVCWYQIKLWSLMNRMPYLSTLWMSVIVSYISIIQMHSYFTPFCI